MGALAEASVPSTRRWIPKGMDVRYTAKAVSDITCIAETDPDQWTGDDPDVPVRVRGVRDDGTTVVEGVIRLWVTEKPAAEPRDRRAATRVRRPTSTVERLLLADQLALHPGGDPGQDQVHGDVHRRQHDRGLQLVGELLEDLLADLGEARRQDRVAEAGVLERHHALADDRRQHDLDALGEQDRGHHLGLAHADGVRRLGLAPRHGQDARPEHLRQHGAVVEGQRDDHGPVGPDATLTGAVGQEDEDHQQQHGHRAEELDHDERGPAHPAVVGQLPDAEHEPEDDGEHDRAEGHLQGLQRADEQGLDERRREERLPQLVGELAGLVHPPDHRTDHDDEQNGAEDGVDAVPPPGRRARGVEQDAAHRATRQRRSREKAPREMASTRIT